MASHLVTAKVDTRKNGETGRLVKGPARTTVGIGVEHYAVAGVTRAIENDPLGSFRSTDERDTVARKLFGHLVG